MTRDRLVLFAGLALTFLLLGTGALCGVTLGAFMLLNDPVPAGWDGIWTWFTVLRVLLGTCAIVAGLVLVIVLCYQVPRVPRYWTNPRETLDDWGL